MVRDLKHRFVDGLILASLDLTGAHTEELRRAAARSSSSAGRRKARPWTSSGRIRARARPPRCATCTRRDAVAIAFVNGPQHTVPGALRKLGYLDGLRSCGLRRTTI